MICNIFNPRSEKPICIAETQVDADQQSVEQKVIIKGKFYQKNEEKWKKQSWAGNENENEYEKNEEEKKRGGKPHDCGLKTNFMIIDGWFVWKEK